MKSNRSSDKNRATSILEKLKESAKDGRRKLLERVKTSATPPAAQPEKPKEEREERTAGGDSEHSQYPFSIPYSQAESAKRREEGRRDKKRHKRRDGGGYVASPPPIPAPTEKDAVRQDVKPEEGGEITPPTLPDTLEGRENRLRTLILDMQERGGFENVILVDSSGLSLFSSSESTSRDAIAAVCVLAVEAIEKATKYIHRGGLFSAAISIGEGRYLALRELKGEGESYYLAAISAYPTVFGNFARYIEAILFELKGGKAR
ncbi:MAG: hypothetical protein Kow0090_22060 [Myxococcota bacterium]